MTPNLYKKATSQQEKKASNCQQMLSRYIGYFPGIKIAFGREKPARWLHKLPARLFLDIFHIGGYFCCEIYSLVFEYNCYI